MATDVERLSALQWAAGMRGSSDEGEALDWMVSRGLVNYDFETATLSFTEDGARRADELVETLQRVPAGARRRRRSTILLVLGTAAAGMAWAARR